MAKHEQRVFWSEDQEDNQRIPWIECIISPVNLGVFQPFHFLMINHSSRLLRFGSTEGEYRLRSLLCRTMVETFWPC